MGPVATLSDERPLTAHTERQLASDTVRHAFFERNGGVSKGLYATLNAGPGSNDDPAAVGENHARIAEAMGLARGRLVAMHQSHSATAVTLSEPPADRPKADAIVTAERGLALMVLTADCAPVLLMDEAAGVIGAAHAGWKGALSGILAATVTAMEGLGARAEQIAAAIGPTIGPASYEVGPEFMHRIVGDEPRANALFRPAARPGHHLFDLPGFVRLRLKSAGVGAVADCGLDTYSDEGRWFSYRRATHRGEADYGRLASVIVRV